MASKTPRRSAGHMGRARGFVLAITLWLLAGITIAVGAMTLWALGQVEQARTDRERLEDEIAVRGTRDTLLYLAATREMTRAGLPVVPMSDSARAVRLLDEMGALVRDPIGGELRLDGSAYIGVAGTTFQLQDESGLFPVVWPRDFDVDRFLLAQGVDREKVPRLRDALLDYIDSDELNRLNGAERRDYERDKRPTPPNRRLRVPHELTRVLGWDRLPPALQETLAERTTPFYSGAVNLNTMPRELLPTWIPGCPETCDALVARRRERPFSSTFELQGRLGIQLPGDDAMDYRYLADETLRLTLWGRTGGAWRFHVRLTPLADKRGPWSILAAYPIPRPSLHESAEDTGSALFTDSTPDQR